MPSEGKCDGKDDEERKHPDGLIGEVRSVLMSAEFVSEFERFAEKHIEPFRAALARGESPLTDGADHSHDFYDTYQLYLEHFEKRVEDHIESCGSTVTEFMRAASASDSSMRDRPTRDFSVCR